MAFGPESRYTQASKEFVITHLYDEFGDAEVDADKKPLTATRETLYLLTTQQADDYVGTTDYMVKDVDNIQLLAYRVYDDPKRWWVIADANPEVRYPLDLSMGRVIRLPS